MTRSSNGKDGRGSGLPIGGSEWPRRAQRVLHEIQGEVLPKSPAGRAVRYGLNQWGPLTRFLADYDLEIDNGATARGNRDIAVGRGNWTFFGSDADGKTAAVLLSFIAMCTRNGVEPFAWFRDVLTRIAQHPIHRIEELLPPNWKAPAAAADA